MNEKVEKGFMKGLLHMLSPADSMKNVLAKRADDIQDVAAEMLEKGSISAEGVKTLEKGMGVNEAMKKYANIDMETMQPTSPDEAKRLVHEGLSNYANDVRETKGMGASAKRVWQEGGIGGAYNVAKDYYTGGNWKQNAARIGATYVGLNTIGLTGRLMSGGTLTTNSNGERDIAGIPFL